MKKKVIVVNTATGVKILDTDGKELKYVPGVKVVELKK